MQHILSLECADTLNLCLLKLSDSSIYNADVAVSCPLLYITLPGFNTPVQVPVQPGFNLNLTACDLGTQTSQCGTVFNNLSDGIYIIKYSVSPNDQVYVEYNHLRISNALTMIQKILCTLDISKCEPTELVDEKLEKLMEIRGYLMAAKAKVEYCLEPRSGQEIYSYALKLLKKFTCHTC